MAHETIKGHKQDIEKDFGPITKVVPIEKFINSNDKVVLVDDDVLYKPNMIQQLLDANLPAVGYAGRKNMNFISGDNIKEKQECDFLETYAGVMYTGAVLKNLWRL